MWTNWLLVLLFQYRRVEVACSFDLLSATTISDINEMDWPYKRLSDRVVNGPSAGEYAICLMRAIRYSRLLAGVVVQRALRCQWPRNGLACRQSRLWLSSQSAQATARRRAENLTRDMSRMVMCCTWLHVPSR